MRLTTRGLLRRAAIEALGRVDRDLARYVRVRRHLREVLPDHLERLDANLLVPAPVAFGSGVDLREAEQLALLASWEDRFESLFSALRANPEINTQAGGQPYLHNDWYPTPDAEVYAAIIADRRPSMIVEIGAGYSSRIARVTIDRCSPETELTIIDPAPRADVSRLAATIVTQRIEDVDPSRLALDDRALLFVDSSHIMRSGGDVPTIFCRLIPQLPAGVRVHVHDVFLPFDYPPAYRLRLYTETYVLWALLARGSACRTVFATHFMSRTYPEQMRAVFGPIVAADDRYFGASFWFDLT